MAVQASSDITNKPFILGGPGLTKQAETVAQDAQRSGDMAVYTLMAKNPSTGKWTPFTDETATDGTQYPRGVLLKKLTEAEIKAGDVVNTPILVGDAIVDQNQLTIENSKTLATIVNVPTNFNTAVEDLLRQIGIFMQDTVDISELEA